MATENVPAPEGATETLTVDRTRAGLGFMATAEIEGLVTLLCREISRAHSEGDIAADLAPALRGIVIRIGSMNSVAMSMLSSDDGRDTGAVYREVYGEAQEAAA